MLWLFFDFRDVSGFLLFCSLWALALLSTLSKDPTGLLPFVFPVLMLATASELPDRGGQGLPWHSGAV